MAAQVGRARSLMFCKSSPPSMTPACLHALEHAQGQHTLCSLAHPSGSSLGRAEVGGISLEGKVQLLAFCVFEGCVGLFWPSMMALRAHFVPEGQRSTIINIFRIPLNCFVCLVLYKVCHMLHEECCFLCAPGIHAWQTARAMEDCRSDPVAPAHAHAAAGVPLPSLRHVWPVCRVPWGMCGVPAAPQLTHPC